MSEEMLVKYCSPTIVGIKTANLFTCRFESKADEHHSLNKLNRLLSSKGLRIIPLRHHKGATLIYIYRPSLLKKDLKNKAASGILKDMGYTCDNINKCLTRLMKKLRTEESFPHEIGLFLGYPPEDVEGFIHNKAEGCKCVGCWKVYGDAEKAQNTFDKYKKCTEICCSLVAKGCSVEKLAVCG